MLPTSTSPSVFLPAHPGQQKSSHSCGTDFPMPHPVFRTRQKESLRFRKSMAKTSASSACIHRSMDQMLHSLTTGAYYLCGTLAVMLRQPSVFVCSYVLKSSTKVWYCLRFCIALPLHSSSSELYNTAYHWHQMSLLVH